LPKKNITPELISAVNNRTILEGDVLEKIKDIPDESIDLICTDPPYGYSFMNKDWDKVVINSDVWRECLRVLKPGSFAFVMSAPRQDVLFRVTKNLGDAGFNIGFTSLYWAYASGFPKAMNVSKAVDKRLGIESEIIGYKKNLGHLERGDKNIDKQTVQHLDTIFTENKGKEFETKPTSPQAKKLDGAYAGFQPKPAVEVILVCMKPLSQKNYVEQALYNQKGVTWFDDCRIPYKNENDVDKSMWSHWKGATPSGSEVYSWNKEKGKTDYVGGASNKGRFPANLIVSDNALDDGKIYKPSGEGKLGKTVHRSSKLFSGYNDLIAHVPGDEGSFSRYFDLDLWEAQFIITPKPSKSEKNEGLDNFTGKKVNDGRKIDADNAFQRGKTQRQNTHPTVKPVSLFKYLVTMGSRPDDTVLDPFMGSGTTAIACEKLARNWIGIEINPEYREIIKARIEKHRKQERLF